MRLKLADGTYVEAVAIAPAVERIVDDGANDSDKSFTVPDGEMWHLNSLLVTLATDATAGNRQIVAEVKDAAGNVLGRISAGAVQAASLTRRYMFMQGTFRENAFINDDIQVPIPQDSYIKAGSSLHVYDSAAVSPTGDDMTVAYSISRIKGA